MRGRRRRGIGLAVLVGAGLALAARAVPVAASARPVADPPPVATALPITTFAPTPGLTFRAVEPTTGRLLADDLAADVTRVYEPDGTAVGTLPRPDPNEPLFGPYFTASAIYYLTDDEVQRYDPVTLAKTGTWGWTRHGVYVATVHAVGDGLYWQELPILDAPKYTYEFDAVTGEVTVIGRELLDGWSSNGRVASQVFWLDQQSSLDVRMGIHQAWSALLPYRHLGRLLTASDGSGAVVPDSGAHLLREFTRNPDDTWTETGVTYPYQGALQSVKVGPAPARVMFVETKVDDAPATVDVFQGGDPEPVAHLGEFGGLPTGFSIDGTVAYRNRNGVIEAVHLDSMLGTPAPTVVGRAGGASVAFGFDGIAPVSATVGGVAASGTATGGSYALTAPALPLGPAAITVTNQVGLTSEAPAPLQVVELGPYGTVPAFVARQYADVVGRTATPSEIEAEMSALADGQVAGALPADLVRARPLNAKDAALVRLYRAVFKRLPDTSGYRYWLAKLEGGTTLAKAAATFAGSSEFKRTYGSLANGPFIDLVYQNVLGRAPDPGGRAYWSKKLGAGTSRGTLVAQFSQSSEYVRKTTSTVERVRLVLAMLDRMPKQAELDFVAAQSLEQVAHSLLTAEQYPAT